VPRTPQRPNFRKKVTEPSASLLVAKSEAIDLKGVVSTLLPRGEASAAMLQSERQFPQQEESERNGDILSHASKVSDATSPHGEG
jgi:hypothetical protein